MSAAARQGGTSPPRCRVPYQPVRLFLPVLAVRWGGGESLVSKYLCMHSEGTFKAPTSL